MLIIFHLASGLQVNFNKSSLMGIHTSEPWLHHATKNMLCKTGSLPFTYLGLPIGGNSSQIEAWDPVVNRMQRSLLHGKARSYR